MLSKRYLLRVLFLMLFSSFILAGVIFARPDGEKSMPDKILFDLNRNIAAVAKESGTSRFEKQNRYGLVSYGLVALPESTVFKYCRPGYEISWNRVFAFTMYADDGYSQDLHVDTVDLQHHGEFDSLGELKVFVEQTIAQFQAGKWERHFLEDTYPRVTGRSSLLDEHDQLRYLDSPDPAYNIPLEDWPTIVNKGIYWYWMGDGVRAELSVSASGSEIERNHYDVTLSFEDEAHVQYINQKNAERLLKRAQERGWPIPDPKEIRQEQMEARQRIEARALERGDQVLP